MKDKLRIAFLTERMLLGFGVDLVVDKTAEGLANLGHDVTVFAINIDETYQNKNYRLKHFPCPLFWNPVKQEYLSFRTLPFIKNIEKEFDILIIETFPFNFYPIFLKIPCLIVDHGIPDCSGMDWKTKIRMEYTRWTQNLIYFNFANQIVTISKFLKSELPSWLQKKTKVIYNGIDHHPKPEDIRSDAKKLRKKLKVKNNETLLLYVGRLYHEKQPYKGTKQLIEIYQKLKRKNKNIRLIMAGFGDEKDKKNLRQKGVIPIVNAPVKLMPVLYSASDIYVTATRWEGFNLPLVEAQYFGKPGVCFDIGPHKEVVRDKRSAFLVDDEKQFIRLTEALMSNKRLYQKMAKEAEKNAKRFTWEKAVEKYNQVIKKTLKASKTSLQKDIYRGKVNVITLNYNGKKFLKPLYQSLEKQTYSNFDVTMVDNASSDGSASFTKKYFPWVNIIENKKNYFFAKGNNIGIKNTQGDYILLVNNDTILKPDAIEQMVKTIEKDPQTAAVAPKMLFYKNKKIFDSIGTVIIPNGSPFNRGIGQVDIGQYDVEEEIFGACFGAVLLKRHVYEKVGPMDNDYFGYFEDVDWCYRAQGMGFKIVSCPKAIIYHNHSGTTKKQTGEWKYYLIHRNYLRTLFKNYGKKNALIWGGRKILSLIKHAKNPPSPERKTTCIRILLNTLLYSPILLVKRIKTRIKRINTITDENIWRFSQDEQPFFDPVKYEPEYTLENIKTSYRKKLALMRKKRVFGRKYRRIRKNLIRLNLLAVNYWLYTKNERETLIDLIEECFQKDMGEKLSHLYIQKIRSLYKN